MKEYDIFLKQRLTEGKIIVYSLPFRDGVSAVNRIVLQALVSYFTMQKKIAIANQSVLVSEIDDMLATVYEKIENQVCLDASAVLTTRYQNELKQAAMELDIPNLPLLALSFFALEDQVGIQVNQPFAYAKSSLGESKNAMVVLAKAWQSKSVFLMRCRLRRFWERMTLTFRNMVLNREIVQSVLIRQAQSCFTDIQLDWKQCLKL